MIQERDLDLPISSFTARPGNPRLHCASSVLHLSALTRKDMQQCTDAEREADGDVSDVSDVITRGLVAAIGLTVGSTLVVSTSR